MHKVLMKDNFINISIHSVNSFINISIHSVNMAINNLTNFYIDLVKLIKSSLCNRFNKANKFLINDITLL